MTGELKGIGLQGVNVGDFRKMPIPVAPIDEQNEIVGRLKRGMDHVTQMETELASSEAELTQLDQSILAKAFRGELVPQDSGDEPASQLLHRIRTTREQAEADEKEKKKATRKRKAKAPSQSSKGS